MFRLHKQRSEWKPTKLCNKTLVKIASENCGKNLKTCRVEDGYMQWFILANGCQLTLLVLIVDLTSHFSWELSSFSEPSPKTNEFQPWVVKIKRKLNWRQVTNAVPDLYRICVSSFSQLSQDTKWGG